MNIVLFLGAGFSKPFGHPVMNEFLVFADNCTTLTSSEHELLDQLVLDARSANSFLDSSPTNIEDILSFFEMTARLDLSDEVASKKQVLRDAICKVYAPALNSEGYWSRFEPFKRIFGPRKLSQRNVAIISTNYDLNIECACKSLRLVTNPGFGIQRRGPKNRRIAEALYGTHGVPLYKLHGSINWFTDPDSSEVYVCDDLRTTIDFDSGRELLLPPILSNDTLNSRSAVIVPPSFLKPELLPALRQVWSAAAKKLSEANIIAFIGYSFPSSDTEMMYFLASSLSVNPNLRKVYLIDPLADQILRRLIDSSGKLGSHFRNLLEPIGAKWEELQAPPWSSYPGVNWTGDLDR